MLIPTCIIGAHYGDGVVIATDKRVVIGSKITDEAKMFLIHRGQIAIAFAGETGIAGDVERYIEKDLKFNKSKTLDAAIEIIEESVAEIRKKYIKRGAFPEDELILEAIACGLDHLSSGQPQLYRIDQRGFGERISENSSEPYYTLGSARDYANSLLKLCYDKQMGKRRIAEVLSYVIVQCESMDTNVGGTPNLAFFERDKQPIILGKDETDKLARKAKNTSETVTRILQRLFGEEEKFSTFLKTLFEREEPYRIFGEYVIDEIVGILKSNRNTRIILENRTDLGPTLIYGHAFSDYDARNISPLQKDLFLIEGEKGLITKGIVTVPPELKKSQIPDEATRFWDLETNETEYPTGVQVNGEKRIPEKIVEWRNQNNHAEGVQYEVSLHEMLFPEESKHVFWATKCIYGTHDYILRRFSNYGVNAQVELKKPLNLEVAVAWFLQVAGERPAKVKLLRPDITPTCYKQKAEGNLVPGNGFVVMWWPRPKR